MSEKCVLTLAELEGNLTAATENHKKCAEAERIAQANLTDARNRLNKAQKALDEGVERLKAAAPWNTDWHSQRQQKVPA